MATRQRPLGERRYKKMFVIASEGQKTEPQYFNLLQSHVSLIKIYNLKSGTASSPTAVLKKMKSHIKIQGLKSSDEAWLVVDKDAWTEEQLNELHQWTRTKENYHLALSNPKFEYWLLLHFEDGTGSPNSSECSRRLENYISNYDKNISRHKFPRTAIEQAVQRAEQKDMPQCTDWPRNNGTTVYRLVKKILTNVS